MGQGWYVTLHGALFGVSTSGVIWTGSVRLRVRKLCELCIIKWVFSCSVWKEAFRGE